MVKLAEHERSVAMKTIGEIREYEPGHEHGNRAERAVLRSYHLVTG